MITLSTTGVVEERPHEERSVVELTSLMVR